MSFKSTAENYLIAGLNPLPLRENKAPNLPKGHKFLYEDNTELFNFESIDTKKIGIACGAVSENLLCIDFDKHQGQNIFDIFHKYTDSQIFRFLVDLKKVAVYKTPSGGYHIIFRTEEPKKGTTLARWEDGEVMIETRGEGQYIACFPSEGYQFIKGSDLCDLKKLEEEESTFLLERAEIFNQDLSNIRKRTGSKVADDQKKWPESWNTETPDGRFNEEGVDHVKKLLNEKGWNLSSSTKELDEVQYWIRPNKNEDDGISATFGFKRNMFYIFTDAKDIMPLEPKTAYSPFQLLVELEYNGDWKQAKDDLRDSYGMESIKSLPKVEFLEDEKKHTDFPIEVFPNDYQAYINETYHTLGYSKDYTACAMISAIATCVGNKMKVKVKNGYIDSPIFWFAIVGSRGANKTHPLAAVIKPFKKIESNNFEKYKHLILEWNALKEDDKRGKQKPQFNQIMISDFTIEALQGALFYNKKGILVYKDELIGFFKDMNKYKKSGGDEEFFLESFNNGSFTINRKTQDTVRLSNIYINIIGTIQDEVLMQLAGEHTDNGLMDRFLFTKSETLAKPLAREELGEEYLMWWESKIGQVFNEIKYTDEEDIIVYEFTDDAFTLLLDIESGYTNIQNDDDTMASMRSYYSKLRTYIKRFALILMIIDHFDEGTELKIDVDHVTRAKKLTDYFAITAENVFIENAQIREKKEIFNTMKGHSIKDKVEQLHKKGMKNSDIAKLVGKSRQYVSKVLKE